MKLARTAGRGKIKIQRPKFKEISAAAPSYGGQAKIQPSNAQTGTRWGCGADQRQHSRGPNQGGLANQTVGLRPDPRRLVRPGVYPAAPVFGGGVGSGRETSGCHSDCPWGSQVWPAGGWPAACQSMALATSRRIWANHQAARARRSAGGSSEGRRWRALNPSSSCSLVVIIFNIIV